MIEALSDALVVVSTASFVDTGVYTRDRCSGLRSTKHGDKAEAAFAVTEQGCPPARPVAFTHSPLRDAGRT